MKKLIATVCIVILASISAQTQSIYAGLYNSDDYYFDFEPDICLEPVYPDPWPLSEIFPLDINNDGTIDISFQTLYSEANFPFHKSWINLADHCEIAFCTDTCIADTLTWGYMCEGAEDEVNQVSKVFQIAEPIGESNNWIYKNEKIWVSYYIHHPCYPHCTHLISPAIVGVRLFVDNDTLYGWVKLIDIGYWELAIDKYACTSSTMNIQEMESSVQIYPNPAGEVLNISTPWSANNAIVAIYDLNGREMFTGKISGRKNEINISNIPSGMYILKYSYQDKVLMKKVLKQ